MYIILQIRDPNFKFCITFKGHAPAGGCVIALCTDYRVMKPNFKIGLNETMLGIVPPFWVEDVTKAVIGQRNTEYSLQTGKLYSTDEAFKVCCVSLFIL